MFEITVCFLLILCVAAITKYRGINLDKEIFISFLRAVLQVMLLSFIILKLFQLSSFFTFLALTVMGFAGALTANKHGKFLKSSLFPTVVSVYISSFSILLLMLLLHVIENKASVVLPLGGMVIGNSMNSISLAFDRLNSELEHEMHYIETMLCLGFSTKQAFEKIERSCIKSAMIPKINNMKALGLVWIPGLMAGMILGGANPVKAAIYQLIIIAMIVVSSFVSSIIVIQTSKRRIFNKHEQIIC